MRADDDVTVLAGVCRTGNMPEALQQRFIRFAVNDVCVNAHSWDRKMIGFERVLCSGCNRRDGIALLRALGCARNREVDFTYVKSFSFCDRFNNRSTRCNELLLRQLYFSRRDCF